MGNSIVYSGNSSLASKMKEGLASIREQKAMLKMMDGIVLLMDVSGSMSEHVGGKRKIDSLREAVAEFNVVRTVRFSSGVFEGHIPEPQGNTQLTEALSYLGTLKPKEVILISDGLPDNPSTAITAAQSLNCPVNTLYIGVGGDDGERFMKTIAEVTGGKELTINIKSNYKMEKSLSEGIKMMLPSGK